MQQIVMGIAILAIWVFNNPVYAGSNQASLWASYPAFKIVINIPATELRLYEGEELLRAFPIAIGQQAYPTPAGFEDALSQIIWNPWWYPPEREWAKEETITPPGPKNPLGVVKMPLSNALLIHGTNQARSIGTPASHACIRMHNEDARTLAWILQSGLTPQFSEDSLKTYEKRRGNSFWIKLARKVPVTFLYEPVEIFGNRLFLHPDIYGKVKNKKEWLAQKLNLDDAVLEVLATQWHQVPNQRLQLDLGLLQSPPKNEPRRRSSLSSPSLW